MSEGESDIRWHGLIGPSGLPISSKGKLPDNVKVIGQQPVARALVSPSDTPLTEFGTEDGITFETKDGTRIPNSHRPERSPEDLEKSKSDLAKDGRELRSLTAKYNCVSMVFANRRVWIEADQIYPILEGDSYRKLSGCSEAMRGDVLVYKNEKDEASHVAILLDKRFSVDDSGFVVLSKWGQFGEYVHLAEDVPPILGKPNEYWTDRKL